MNANMEYSCVQLNNLPDEILLTIFKNLSNLGVLYYLYGVNKRFNRLLHDPTFTKRLMLIGCEPNGSICSLPNQIVDRFCLHILPEIHDKIKWLNLESISMERILLATNYSNLYRLGLFNIEQEKAVPLFNDKTPLQDTLREQILSFEIRFTDPEPFTSSKSLYALIFAQIFTMFTNLQYLYFGLSSVGCHRLTFIISSPTIFSSTLRQLHVNVRFYEDCLYLLDGRFTNLHTFHVNIWFTMLPPGTIISNKEKLPNLKCFSLTQDTVVYAYDEFIIPLLYRMSNLETLALIFVAERDKSFIDGNELKTNIINNMPRLTNFTFNIYSIISINNQMDLLTTEDIQNTFRDFQNNQIISCVNYFPDLNQGQCHIYSSPFRMKRYEHIANNFPGGIFRCVREVSLYDEHPFEHEFFIRIAQSFPFMNRLSITNHKPQNKKLYNTSKNNNQQLSIIKYLHLTCLNLIHTHHDYVEQFLLDSKTHLPNNVHLYVEYKSLKIVTRSFKRRATRINCVKVGYLSTTFVRFPKHFKDYFPHTNVL